MSNRGPASHGEDVGPLDPLPGEQPIRRRPLDPRTLNEALAKYRPIVVVDFASKDRHRVALALDKLDARATPAQLEELRVACLPLPDDDEDLVTKLIPFVRIDWQGIEDQIEPTLRDLCRKCDQAPDDDARRRIERRLLVATADLDEHPRWFTHPCYCEECRSYG